MSAINPASFQTPTSSLGLQPAYSGNAFGPVREATTPRRRPQFGLGLSQPNYDENDPLPTMQNNGVQRYPFHYGSYGAGAQQGGHEGMGYAPAPQSPIDPYSQFMGQQYGMLNPHAPNFASTRQGPQSRAGNHNAEQNWGARFQGLSLGS